RRAHPAPRPRDLFMTESVRRRFLSGATAALAMVTLATAVSAQNPPPARPLSRQLAADVERATSSVLAERFSEIDPVRGRIVSAFVHGPVSADALRALGVEVDTQAGIVTTVRMPVSALAQVAQLPGVQAIRMAMPVKLHLDASIPDTRANLKRTQSPPLAGFNGTNVVVGFIDSGIEYSHD